MGKLLTRLFAAKDTLLYENFSGFAADVHLLRNIVRTVQVIKFEKAETDLRNL